jgi:hypothetical protein
VLGPGCIAEELGDPALMEPPDPDRPMTGPAIAIAGAAAAVLATAGDTGRAVLAARPLSSVTQLPAGLLAQLRG